METRANYVLIGAFTLAGILGTLGFLLWFARVELDRSFAYYDITFDSVAGLGRASDVRFAGLPVGQVVQVGLSPARDGRILVRIEVKADTPVRTDSIATIEAQGVTGVSYVALSPGTPAAPLLAEVSEEPFPVITAGRSVLQTLTDDAPELLAEFLRVAQQLTELLGGDNAARVEAILTNLEASSNSFASALDDFSAVGDSVSTAAADIAGFTRQLDGIGAATVAVLERAETSLDAVTGLAGRAVETLDAGDAMLAEARDAFAVASRVMAEDLPVIADDLRATSEILRTRLDSVSAEASDMLRSFTDAGTAATARLTEAEGTLQAADAMIERLTGTMETVDRAADRLDGLLAGDAARLLAEGADLAGRAFATLDAGDAALAEARRVMAGAGRFLDDDLPAISAELRETNTALRGQIEALGGEAGALMAEFRGAGTAANARLAEAEVTLRAADEMFEQFTVTMQTLGDAATRFDQMMTTDGAAMVADARTAIASASEAIGTIARVTEEDLPLVMADVRAAAATARQVIEDAGGALGRASGRVEEVADGTLTALGSVTDTFANANATLAAIDRAMASGERALDSAESVFAGADRVIREDVSAITADLRQSMARFDTAIAQVSADLPEVTAELRSATAAASAAFAELGSVITASGPPVRDFAVTGLAQYTRLAQETRGLIGNLERLIRQIERDPARFFLSRQTPEFRR